MHGSCCAFWKVRLPKTELITADISHLCITVALVRIYQAGLYGIALKKASCLTFVALLYFFIICWECLRLRSCNKVNVRKQIYLYPEVVYSFFLELWGFKMFMITTGNTLRLGKKRKYLFV